MLLAQGGVLHHPFVVLCGGQDQPATLWQEKLQQGCAWLRLLGAHPCCALHFPEAVPSGRPAEQATNRRVEGLDAGQCPFFPHLPPSSGKKGLHKKLKTVQKISREMLGR